MKNKKVETRGRKPLFKNDPLEGNHLTEGQNRQLQEIADSRKIPVTFVLREAVDWYLTAVARSQQPGGIITKEESEFEKLTS
jgi:hypothetical protein